MKLTRCTCQSSETVEEFYLKLSRTKDNGVSRDTAQAMLGLIAKIQSIPGDAVVWGLTSMQRLYLLAKDDYTSDKFVMFYALDNSNYFVEYLIPEYLAPWPGAYVTGEARTEDQAFEMIRIGLEKSEFWKAIAD